MRPKKGGQAAQALGRSRGGFTTKRHVSVDGLGNPLRTTLTAGQTHDCTQALVLFEGLAGAHVLADRAYDTDAFIAAIRATHAIPCMPAHPRRTTLRDYDTWRYRERPLIECVFNTLKHFRRVFSRFDKLAPRFLSFVHFPAALIWMR